MDWNLMQGRWKEAQAKLRLRWNKLTDEDLAEIAGKRDQLVGTLQRKYGEAKDEIERQVRDFEDRYSTM